MAHTFYIQNLKCGGCAKTITRELSELDGVSDVLVDKDASTVTFESTQEDTSNVHDRLNELGYPVDTDENSVLMKAKSYVSCVRGKMGE